MLPAYLKGLAEQTFYSLTPDESTSWSAAWNTLQKRFYPPEARQVHIAALHAKMRGKDEDLQQLRCDISRLVELAYPDDPLNIVNRTSRDLFVGALTPNSLKENVLVLNPQTLDEAIAAAQRFEMNRKVLEKGAARVLAVGLRDELTTKHSKAMCWGTNSADCWRAH